MRNLQDKIENAGLRVTAQRLMIAETVFGALNHPTAEDLMRALSERKVLVSQATVYNTLHAFVEGGLLQEVRLGDGRTVYDHNIEPHHHFIDDDSNEVLDIGLDEVQLSADCLRRFDIDSVQMVIRGKRKLTQGQR